ncbi:MAG: S9 family peptidase, partial [Novosphingobium sp.]
MRHLLLALTALTMPALAHAQETAPAAPAAAKPAALIADGIPAVPLDLVDATRPYMEFRTAGFVDWDPVTKSMLISTRFGNVAQLHSVKGPGMARTQISFEPEPLSGTYLPGDGTMIVSKDKGGNEFYQLYTMKNGKLTLLTDGKSRNGLNAVSLDGKWIAYSSTRRNGTDNDL